MEDLIKALQIFLKYKNNKYPTHCEHDVLYVYHIKLEDVTMEDREELESLGFKYDEDYECWKSYRYGSV